jgi:predicted nucleic acid-binding protein
MKILVDTNILLDVLAKRQPFYSASAQVWSYAERGDITAFISLISYNNVYYVVRKAEGKAKAETAMRLLRDVFRTVSADDQTVNQCIDFEMDDFEDAIQRCSAVRAKVECLVTRDPEHFSESDIPVLTPSEFLAVLEARAD